MRLGNRLPARMRIPQLGGALAIATLCAAPFLGQAQSRTEVPLLLEGPASPVPWQRYRGWNEAKWDDYNTLADLSRSPPAPEPGKLRPVDTPIAGDAQKGMKLAFDRSRGGACVACHVMGPQTPELPGNVGPDLSLIGQVGRPDDYLFNYVWDPRIFNPDTVMIPWGAHNYYSEGEIKDIVAFLKTLNKEAVFKNPLEDPEKRPLPVEDRDNLDAFVNPAVDAVDTAKALLAKAGPSGQSCLSCHADPDSVFKTWAATMPRYEPRLKRVLGVAEFVYRHAAATTGDKLPMQSPNNTALTVYLHNAANGAPIKVDTESPGAKEAYARGEELMTKKIGQGNFACVDCHSPERGANKWIRGQYLGETKGQLDHFPTWRTSRNEIWDIRKRLQWCNVQIRANDLPPDAREYGDLELYVTAQSNGLPLNTPGIRH